jgi:hypothetical protein
MAFIPIIIYCVLNKEEFPDHWKESVMVSVYKSGDR